MGSMMRVGAVAAVVVVVAVVAAPGVRADARGKVSFRGASFSVADAVAYKTDHGVEVAILPAAFDRKAAAKDRKIDSFDMMRMGGPRITPRIDSDGSFSCIDYSDGNGGGTSCDGDYTMAFTLTARTADRAAGTFRYKAGPDAVDLTFDLKVESVAAPTGTALPADDGARPRRAGALRGSREERLQSAQSELVTRAAGNDHGC